MIVSFDLTGVLFLIILPPVILFLCRLAWELAQMIRSGILLKMQKQYISDNTELVYQYNKLLKENRELSDKVIKHNQELFKECLNK